MMQETLSILREPVSEPVCPSSQADPQTALFTFLGPYVFLVKDISLDINHGFCGQFLPKAITQGYSESCLKIFIFIWNCLMP